jgi:hypothetical protein
MSNVKRVMCHAEFTCARCAKPYVCMAIAPWDDVLKVIGDGERIGREICNDCNAADREAERKAYNKSRQQSAWKRRAEKLSRRGAQ